MKFWGCVSLIDRDTSLISLCNKWMLYECNAIRCWNKFSYGPMYTSITNYVTDRHGDGYAFFPCENLQTNRRRCLSYLVYCLALGRPQTRCNVSSTQPIESCRTAASTTVDSPTSGDMFYIGSTGSDSDCASRCSSVSTAWLLDTWPSSAALSPASTDTGIYRPTICSPWPAWRSNS